MLIDLDCDLCPLKQGRTKVVAPTGDLFSPVVFIGEAPGEKEDLSGIPFVGRAGKLLDRMLEEEKLPRDRIMITNVVKCRPPGNRRPKQEEIEACRAYLEDELRGRELIVTLGKTASECILGRDLKMKEVANQIFTVSLRGERIDVIPTYHPSAALRNVQAREGLRNVIKTVKQRFPDF